MTDYFEIKEGAQKGSALKSMLFIKVIEKATRNYHSMVPWHTLFADDLPISSEMEFHVIEKLNSWIKALQKCGLKINVATTKHLISGKKVFTQIFGKYLYACYLK